MSPTYRIARFAGMITDVAANSPQHAIFESIIDAIKSFKFESMMNDLYRQDAALRRIQKVEKLIDGVIYYSERRRIIIHAVTGIDRDEHPNNDMMLQTFENLVLKSVRTIGRTNISLSFCDFSWLSNYVPSIAISRALMKLGNFDVTISSRHVNAVVGEGVELWNTGAMITVECKNLLLSGASAKIGNDIKKIKNVNIYDKCTLNFSGEVGSAHVEENSNFTLIGNPQLNFGFGRECQYFRVIKAIMARGVSRIVFSESTTILNGDVHTFYPDVKYQNFVINFRCIRGSTDERKTKVQKMLNALKYARNLTIILPIKRNQVEYRPWLPAWLLGPESRFYEKRVGMVPYCNIYITWVKREDEIPEIPEFTGAVVTKKFKHLCPIAGLIDRDLMTPEEFSAMLSSADISLDRLPRDVKNFILEFF